ncbi:MAG: hypothetical protein Q8Q80_04090 [Methyloversatilis sp.]|nr:hypothetical protein [Methyloversatilis sp.]MDP3871822.1 hypothetical protein [Methyloversatilis sp.]
MHRRPDVQRIEIDQRLLLRCVAMHTSQHLTQDVEGVRGVAHQVGMRGRRRPRCAEHQPVLQRMAMREIEVLPTQRAEIVPGIVELPARVEVG